MVFLVNNTVVFAKQEAPNQDFFNNYFSDVNLINSASQMAEAKKSINQPFFEQLMSHSLEHNDVQNIKVENNSGLQRILVSMMVFKNVYSER